MPWNQDNNIFESWNMHFVKSLKFMIDVITIYIEIAHLNNEYG